MPQSNRHLRIKFIRETQTYLSEHLGCAIGQRERFLQIAPPHHHGPPAGDNAGRQKAVESANPPTYLD